MDVGQHTVEIHANAERWRRKPLLQEIYRDFYLEIASELRHDLPGATVEIGSGIGNLKSVVPHAVATDLFANPWLDRIENAYALTFADESSLTSSCSMSGIISNIQERPWPNFIGC